MYTYISNIGNSIYVKYYEDGKPIYKVDKKFKPELFLRSATKTKYKSFVRNEYLDRYQFDNVKEYKEYVYSTDNSKIYGHLGKNGVLNQYIRDKGLGLDQDFTKLNCYFIDIENLAPDSHKGVPCPVEAKFPITAITMINLRDGSTTLWALRLPSLDKKQKIFSKFKMLVQRFPEMEKYKTFKNARLSAKKDKFSKEIKEYIRFIKKIDVRKFTDEDDLLNDFVAFFSEVNIDVISGWNSELYDMPYIYNRLVKRFSKKILRNMSPFGMYKQITLKDMRKKEIPSYEIVGINTIDFMGVYKKFVRGERPSWKLKDVAKEELKHTKIEHEESFWQFYHNDPEIYMAYNIVDTYLLYLMEKKLNYIKTAHIITHICDTLLQDYEYNTILWDSKLASVLRCTDIIIPPNDEHMKHKIEGAYNKQIVPNKHKWVVSFDLNSLYPHLIMQYNISPETYVPFERIKDKKLIKMSLLAQKKVNHIEPFPHSQGVDLTLDNDPRIDYDYISACGYIMTPCGAFFTNKRRGLAPILMEQTYDRRKELNKKAKDLYNRAEISKDASEIKNMLAEAKIHDNIQYALKIFLNAFYGAFLKDSFRYYNKDIGSSITSAGQLSIRFIIKWINSFLDDELKNKNKDYVIGSSTDSMYIGMEEAMKKLYDGDKKDKFQQINWLKNYSDETISHQLSLGYQHLATQVRAFENKMRMGREVIADSAFWLNKRYYALRIFSDDKVDLYKKPKIKITGFPIVKSDIPACVKPVMKKMIIMILDDVSSRKIHQVYLWFERKFREYSYKDIAVSRNVNYIDKYISEKKNKSSWKDNVSNYKQKEEGATYETSKGAIIYNNLIDKYNLPQDYKLVEGEKAKFIFLKIPNPINESYIAFNEKLYDEFNLSDKIDYKSQFTRVFGKIMLDTMRKLKLNYKSSWKK